MMLRTQCYRAIYLLLYFFCFIQTGCTEKSPVEIKDKVHREEEARALYKFIADVLEDYDVKLRPNAGGKAVQVLVEFKVISFGQIVEADMEYTMDIFMRQWWYDPRFKNNFSIPFNIAADPTQLFWTPDTYFWNVKHSKYHFVTRENMRVMIWPDGKVYYSARITLTAQCDMDLRMYPMDTQHCNLIIESYAFTTRDVDYHWKGGDSQGIEIVSSQMAQFDLVDVKTSTKATTNSKGSFASLKATFSFRRRTESYVSSVYIPTVVLVILSWCCFFINPGAVPARVALSITTILTTILLKSEVNANMPKVSYMKAVDYFLLISFCFIFSALIEYIMVLNTNPKFAHAYAKLRSKLSWIRRRQNANKKDAEVGGADIVVQVMDNGICRVRNTRVNLRRQSSNTHSQKEEPQELEEESEKMHGNNPKGTYHWIDRISQFCFPITYVIFLFAYTIYYTIQRNKQ